MMKYFSNLLWAMFFASSNRHVIAHLIKHKSWYISHDWHPSNFMDLEKSIEEAKARNGALLEMLYKKPTDYEQFHALEVKYDELNSKYELEVVKLKDLIQAKDLVIERMSEQLHKENGNEQTKLE